MGGSCANTLKGVDSLHNQIWGVNMKKHLIYWPIVG